MTKTKWWLRVVGGFYLFLALTSLWVLFANPQMLGTLFPFTAEFMREKPFENYSVHFRLAR